MKPTVQNIGSVLFISGIPIPFSEIQYARVDHPWGQVTILTHGRVYLAASISGQTLKEAEQAIKTAKQARRASQAQREAHYKSVLEFFQAYQDDLETRGKTKRAKR